MNLCQCKSGFFALRGCEWNAITQCASCRRMICAAHTAEGSAPAVCLDCWARQNQQPSPADANRDAYDDNWAYGYRSHYYSSGYRPSHYDDQDARSFTADQRELDDDASDDPRAGFGDS